MSRASSYRTGGTRGDGPIAPLAPRRTLPAGGQAAPSIGNYTPITTFVLKGFTLDETFLVTGVNEHGLQGTNLSHNVKINPEVGAIFLASWNNLSGDQREGLFIFIGEGVFFPLKTNQTDFESLTYMATGLLATPPADRVSICGFVALKDIYGAMRYSQTPQLTEAALFYERRLTEELFAAGAGIVMTAARMAVQDQAATQFLQQMGTVINGANYARSVISVAKSTGHGVIGLLSLLDKKDAAVTHLTASGELVAATRYTALEANLASQRSLTEQRQLELDSASERLRSMEEVIQMVRDQLARQQHQAVTSTPVEPVALQSGQRRIRLGNPDEQSSS